MEELLPQNGYEWQALFFIISFGLTIVGVFLPSELKKLFRRT